MERALIVCVTCLLLAALASHARADATTRTFALIIANNRSTHATQPDLQYADDDGARYYKLLRAIGDAAHITLLTTFDRASQAQYGELVSVARPPATAELIAARDRLVTEVRAARGRGEQTTLYLVFAGHGEVVEGRGMLDLEDRQIDGAFLERELLAAIPADTKHLVLDSCDSFFVVNPRKPGGRRWATPKDMAFGFSARHPEVGLFLSTNSESEVYEWSELESGVFSHEVRSGLRGGADVDGDGAVTYLELAGFVEHANRGIRREILRPQLFFRGPHGDPNAALFFPAAMRGRRVELADAPARLWIKSEDGERLLDVHKEPGPLTLVVPEGVGELAVYAQHETRAAPVVTEWSAPTGAAPVRLAALTPRAPAAAPRGSRLFGELFRDAYGKRALSAYVAARAHTAEPVYGLSASDVIRMHSYVAQLADEGRARRVLQSTATLGLAGMTMSAVVALSVQPDRAETRNLALGLSGLTAGLIGGGLYLALRPSTSERALRIFERERRDAAGDAGRTFVETERALGALTERERRTRMAGFWLYQGVSVTYAALAIQALTDSESARRERAVSSALFFAGAATFVALGTTLRFTPTPTERLMRLYREDPRVKVQLGGSADRRGASLSLRARF